MLNGGAGECYPNIVLICRHDSSTTVSPSSCCVCRKKSEYRHSATSWLSDRLYAIAADPPQARIRTTTPRRLHPSQIPSLCFPRRVTQTPPRTITPSRLPSPTPPTSTRPTARWAATTVTTARSHCCISRRGTDGGGKGRGRESHNAHTGGDTKHNETLWLSLVPAMSTAAV